MKTSRNTSFFLFLAITAALAGCGTMKGVMDSLWIPQKSAASTTQPQEHAKNPYQGGPSTRRLERPDIPQERVSVPVERLPSLRERDTSSIELMWQIPQKPVSTYRITYGFRRDQLDQSKEISVASLEKFNDAVHGSVYRYFLNDVPADKSTFVSISAIEGGKESAPSAPIEVRPGTSEVKAPRPTTPSLLQ